MVQSLLAATLLSSLLAGSAFAAETGPVSTNSDALYRATTVGGASCFCASRIPTVGNP